VERFTAVMKFCLTHPGQNFSLLDLVKATNIPQSTCHSILASLVQLNYIYRHANRTYSIGPSLVSLAIAARRQYSPLQIARDELRLLADELDVVAVLVEREGSELVVRERAASVSHLGFPTPASQRYPLFPRGGFTLVTLSAEARDATIDRLQPPLSREEREDLLAQVAFLAGHGFAFAAFHLDEPEPLHGLSADWLASTRYVRELDHARRYATSFIIAPVYDGRGEVVFGIALAGFKGYAAGGDVEALGHRLISVCQKLSYLIAGAQGQGDRAPAF
jgi:DNA-binding IclR family transcriptional regulator